MRFLALCWWLPSLALSALSWRTLFTLHFTARIPKVPWCHKKWNQQLPLSASRKVLWWCSQPGRTVWWQVRCLQLQMSPKLPREQSVLMLHWVFPCLCMTSDPQCCCSKEDPEISDTFQPPSLQKNLPAAKSLQERLRNKMAMEIWSLKARSDSPEEQKGKTPLPSDGKQHSCKLHGQG